MKKVNWQYLIDVLLFISIVGVVSIGFLLAFVIPKGPSATDSAKYFLGLHRHEWGDIHLYLGIAFTILAVVHLILGWNWVKSKTRRLFGPGWKAALLVMCTLPFVILAVSWTVVPGEPGIYGHEDAELNQLDRGFLGTGQPPPYHASDTLPATKRSSENVRPSPMTLESAANTKTSEERRPDQHGQADGALARGRGSENTPGILVTGQTTLRDLERQTGISAPVLANHLGLPRSTGHEERLGRLRKRYQFTMQDVRDVISSLLEQKGTKSK